MNSEPVAERPPLRHLPVVLLFASFMAYSALRVPVPGVNEPHYLTKSRHYWQPEWCAGDLFLESANAHLFFYQTVGSLTAVCSLELSAWLGRAAACLLLAAGWNHFVGCLTKTRFGSIWSLWMFLLLHAAGNFSGEWLVGGVEAKVFAYGFAFWGFGCLLRGQATGAAVMLGLAVSMHPVVGVWSVAAAGAATIVMLRTDPGQGLESLTTSLRGWKGLRALALFAVACLPGLLPATQLLLSVDPDLSRQADFIQFTDRLPHHLDPLTFSLTSYTCYMAMILTTTVLVMRLRKSTGAEPWAQLKWSAWLTAASILAAIAGLLIAVGPRPADLMAYSEIRLALLKFYPFRLADVLVPLLLSILTVRIVESVTEAGKRGFLLAWVGSGIALVASLSIPGKDQHPSGMDPRTHILWLDTCEWLRSETPPDAMVYAMHEEWALKWYAERPEYVSFKDCPQDAAGIVEWHARQQFLDRWIEAAIEDGIIDQTELQRLHQATGISYLVSRWLPWMYRPPAYWNDRFCVYAVDDGDLTVNENAN